MKRPIRSPIESARPLRSIVAGETGQAWKARSRGIATAYVIKFAPAASKRAPPKLVDIPELPSMSPVLLWHAYIDAYIINDPVTRNRDRERLRNIKAITI